MQAASVTPAHGQPRDESKIDFSGFDPATLPKAGFHTKASLSAREQILNGFSAPAPDPSPDDVETFDTPEHDDIGAGLSLKWHDGQSYPAKSQLLTLTNGKQLTYGKINCLAGDFYGSRHPVCTGRDSTEQLNFFKKAFNLLDVNSKTLAEIDAIEKIEQKYQAGPLDDPKNKDLPPSKVYSEMNSTGMSEEWTVATFGRSPPDYDDSYPSYFGLSLINFDHFGQDAEKTYNIGHAWALQVAGSSKDPASLEYAYRINAFADHFLQDRFASGHLRTPRRDLHNESVNLFGSDISFPDKDYCAKFMHDEDSALGLLVTNPKGETWTCYGDDYMLDACSLGDASHNNTARVIAAVQASADEIYSAWSEAWGASSSSPSHPFPDPTSYVAWQHAPTLASANAITQTVAPLFRKVDGKLLRRGSWLTGITDRKNWNSWADMGSIFSSYAATLATMQLSKRWEYPLSA